MYQQWQNATPARSFDPSLQVHLPDDLYQKIMYWVQKATGECSGFGRVVFENGVYRITSAMLLEQTNSSADTEIDGDDLAKALYETRNDKGEMHWWWHSHVNMDVFWSGTDREAIELIGGQGYCLATVFNKREQHRTAIYRRAEGGLPPVWVDNLPLFTPRLLPKDLTDAWDAEFDAKCKAWKPTYTYPSYGGGHSSYQTQGEKFEDACWDLVEHFENDLTQERYTQTHAANDSYDVMYWDIVADMERKKIREEFPYPNPCDKGTPGFYSAEALWLYSKKHPAFADMMVKRINQRLLTLEAAFKARAQERQKIEEAKKGAPPESPATLSAGFNRQVNAEQEPLALEHMPH